MKLELTVEEINSVLVALGHAPYAQVFELVQKIRQQAQDQMKVQKEQDNG